MVFLMSANDSVAHTHARANTRARRMKYKILANEEVSDDGRQLQRDCEADEKKQRKMLEQQQNDKIVNNDDDDDGRAHTQ